MKKNVYICSGKTGGASATETYNKRDKSVVPIPRTCSSQFCQKQQEQRSFCTYIKQFLKMAKLGKLFNLLNNSKRIKFYGKTVIDGKAITSKKYNDALSAMEWGKKQINRECTAIYCITVSGEHIAMNVQFI